MTARLDPRCNIEARHCIAQEQILRSHPRNLGRIDCQLRGIPLRTRRMPQSTIELLAPRSRKPIYARRLADADLDRLPIAEQRLPEGIEFLNGCAGAVPQHA